MLAPAEAPVLPTSSIAKRKAACGECRARKRTCSTALTGAFPCTNCQKAKRVCGGPAPSAPGGGAHVVKSLRNIQAQKRSLEEVVTWWPPSYQATSKINSTNWHLASVQLSYSLQYHLIQEHLSSYSAFPKEGPREFDPIELKFISHGRVDELALVDELAVQSFVLRGSSTSTHSALVGSSHSRVSYTGFDHPPSRDFVSCGFSRDAVQANIQARMVNLLLQLPLLVDSYEQSLERVLLAYTCVASLRRADTGTKLEIYRYLIRTGESLLDREGVSDMLKLHIRKPLADMAREELIICLMEGRVSVLSSQLFHKVVPKPRATYPTQLTLSLLDLLLINSTDPTSLDEYEELRTSLLQPLSGTWSAVLGLLSFTTTAKIVESLHRAWQLLDWCIYHVTMYFQTISAGRCSRGEFSTREADFLRWTFSFETCIFDVLLAIQGHVGHKFTDDEDLMGTAMKTLATAKVHFALSKIVEHYCIMKALDFSSSRAEMAIASRFAGVCWQARGTTLDSWLQANPSLALLVVEAALYSSFTSARYASFAMDLSRRFNSFPTPNPDEGVASEEMVQSALIELGGL